MISQRSMAIARSPEGPAGRGRRNGGVSSARVGAECSWSSYPLAVPEAGADTPTQAAVIGSVQARADRASRLRMAAGYAMSGR